MVDEYMLTEAEIALVKLLETLDKTAPAHGQSPADSDCIMRHAARQAAEDLTAHKHTTHTMSPAGEITVQGAKGGQSEAGSLSSSSSSSSDDTIFRQIANHMDPHGKHTTFSTRCHSQEGETGNPEPGFAAKPRRRHQGLLSQELLAHKGRDDSEVQQSTSAADEPQVSDAVAEAALHGSSSMGKVHPLHTGSAHCKAHEYACVSA